VLMAASFVAAALATVPIRTARGSSPRGGSVPSAEPGE
jgi:hypothetical protein